jgi:hypothetical protein
MNCLRPFEHYGRGFESTRDMDVCLRLFCVCVVLCRYIFTPSYFFMVCSNNELITGETYLSYWISKSLYSTKPEIARYLFTAFSILHFPPHFYARLLWSHSIAGPRGYYGYTCRSDNWEAADARVYALLLRNRFSYCAAADL